MALEYRQYLKSDKWKSKRLKVLFRAKFRCEVCKKRQATQIHHLTYKRVYNEKLSDLQAVCGRCHLQIHNIEEQKKRGQLSMFNGLKKVLARTIK